MDIRSIMTCPSRLAVATESGELACDRSGEQWTRGDIIVRTALSNGRLDVRVAAPQTPIKRLHLFWPCPMQGALRFLGDHWERSYGDLEWRGMVPDRVMPWYFLVTDGHRTQACGVRTGASAMCWWQTDSCGVHLWMDVRSGGTPVRLGNRELDVASVVWRVGEPDEAPFQVGRAFCSMMCDRALKTDRPVYGGNDWYYAYGHNSEQTVLRDAEILASLCPSGDNRPFMVIDAGWNLCGNFGPWVSGNKSFPDMSALAAKMKRLGVRPGIWIAPLRSRESLPPPCYFPNKRMDDFEPPCHVLDPSVPQVLETIAAEVRRIRQWGFELIKYDWSTWDLFGRYGNAMGSLITPDGWAFRGDVSRTSAEIITDLYRTLRRAADKVVLIGCNTIGHLIAGYAHLQRVGDDTSGREWEPNRKNGVNAIAFRMIQHDAFFAADADCVAVTESVPWAKNAQWLDLVARSGTPLFASIDPTALDGERKRALRDAFAAAATRAEPAEPLDWLDTTCPERWRMNGVERRYDWYD